MPKKRAVARVAIFSAVQHFPLVSEVHRHDLAASDLAVIGGSHFRVEGGRRCSPWSRRLAIRLPCAFSPYGRG